MNSDAPLLAVDWGTTNRRAFAIGRDGAILDRLADGMGITSVPAGGFPAEIAMLRERFGDGPMLLAGMVGSNRGWIEAPYLDSPLGLETLARGLVRASEGPTFIVPGLCDRGAGRADVMRGEEVQLLGAVAAGLMPTGSDVCHPGTHAKWAAMREGSIASFKTVMTGELFALVRKHGILAAHLDGEVKVGPAFLAGVRRAREHGELLADLFGIRAQVLLDTLREEDAPSYCSGLLIGSDLRIGLAFVSTDAPLAVIGDPALTRLYEAALQAFGMSCAVIDGEQAFVAGIRAIAERLT